MVDNYNKIIYNRCVFLGNTIMKSKSVGVFGASTVPLERGVVGRTKRRCLAVHALHPAS